MKNQIKQKLIVLHTNLDTEFKELSALRNELFNLQKFDMADNIYDFERNIQNLMQCICTHLNNFNDEF